MIFNYSEIAIAIVIITGIIGYEISLYTIYQYNSHRKEGLRYNTFFLNFGSYFFFLISGYVTIIISQFYFLDYNHDYSAFVFTWKLGTCLIFIGLIILLNLAFKEPFDEIMNKYYSTLFTLISISSIFIVLITDYRSFLSNLFVSLNLISGLYILIVQIQLIKLLQSKIKKRFIFIFIGEFIGALGLYIRSFSTIFLNLPDLVIIIDFATINYLFLGVMLVFLGLYKFPLFLEFGWRDYLNRFLVINLADFGILYDYSFKSQNSTSPIGIKLEFIIPRGIIGVNKLFSRFSETKDKIINRIEIGDSVVYYKPDAQESIGYILMVEKTMRSLDFFIDLLKDKFEEMYKPFLIYPEILIETDKSIFNNFKNIIEGYL